MSFNIEDLFASDESNARVLENEEDSSAYNPAKKLAIVTCMDARIHVPEIFGLNINDAHIIRNAGGSAREALRSLVISQQFLETERVIIMKHTACGMDGITNEEVYQRVKKNLGVSAEHIDFLTFEGLEQAVRDDMEFLRTHPLMTPTARRNIRGCIFNVERKQWIR